MDTRAATLDISREGGVDISDADAAVGDVKDPKTFYSVTAPRKTGTMVTRTLNPANEDVLAGYYDVTTLSAVDPDLASANIKYGVTIFGKAGSTNVRDTSDANAAVSDVKSGKTFYAGGGAKKTGTMPTVAIAANSDSYPNGYHVGDALGLDQIETDLAAGNIKSGVNIFGKVGTLSTTPAQDTSGTAKSTHTCTTSFSGYEGFITVGAEGSTVLVEVIPTFNANSLAFATGFFHGNGLAYNTLKLQLVMGGAQVAESGYITSTDNYVITGFRSLSGSQSCYMRVHNYGGSTNYLYSYTDGTGEYHGNAISVGSVKV